MGQFTAISRHRLFLSEDAVIDYNKDRFCGQLTFRAPNSKIVPKLGEILKPRNVSNYVSLSRESSKSSGAWGYDAIGGFNMRVGITTDYSYGGGCQATFCS